MRVLRKRAWFRAHGAKIARGDQIRHARARWNINRRGAFGAAATAAASTCSAGASTASRSPRGRARVDCLWLCCCLHVCLHGAPARAMPGALPTTARFYHLFLKIASGGVQNPPMSCSTPFSPTARPTRPRPSTPRHELLLSHGGSVAGPIGEVLVDAGASESVILETGVFFTPVFAGRPAEQRPLPLGPPS
jgi:hypothetical protein